MSAFGASIKLFSAGLESRGRSRSLGILFANFKNLATKSYEAETLGIDKLILVNGPAYIEKVNQLKLGRYVTRMTETNNAFKTLFGGRMVSTANTESYDMKLIRAESTDLYTTILPTMC